MLKSESQQEKAMIFLHIPKTAGSTLNGILEDQYLPSSIFSVQGIYPQDIDVELHQLSDNQKKEIKLVKGHMYFGLHRLLPESAIYTSIIRDPVDRIISHYYYVLQHKGHYLHEAIISKQMSLEDYVTSGLSVELNNGQTRLLAGTGNSATDVLSFGCCSRELLENAKKNIQEYFICIGLMERFDETLILLKRFCGWKTPYYARYNVNKKRPSKSNVSEKTIEQIKSANKLDIELYQFVKERFDEQITQERYFDLEVKAFKATNSLAYQPYAKINSFTRYAARKASKVI